MYSEMGMTYWLEQARLKCTNLGSGNLRIDAHAVTRERQHEWTASKAK
jgi:hypothetical protein